LSYRSHGVLSQLLEKEQLLASQKAALEEAQSKAAATTAAPASVCFQSCSGVLFHARTRTVC
jgi:hypothetical protein